MRSVVVIPAFNEARTLADVVQSALPHVDGVLVIDDGSTDGTAETVYPLPVHVLAHERNEGKSASLVDGLAWALEREVDWVVTMDADGQHRGGDIPRLLHAAALHPDALIIGARTRRAASAPRLRRAANRFADFFVSWAAGHRLLDSQSGQRVYPLALLRALPLQRLARDGFTLESQLVIEAARLGFRTVSVPIDAIYVPGARASYFRPVPHIWAITRMVARNLLADALKLDGLWTSVRGHAVVCDDRSDAAVPALRTAGVQRPLAPASLSLQFHQDGGGSSSAAQQR